MTCNCLSIFRAKLNVPTRIFSFVKTKRDLIRETKCHRKRCSFFSAVFPHYSPFFPSGYFPTLCKSLRVPRTWEARLLDQKDFQLYPFYWLSYFCVIFFPLYTKNLLISPRLTLILYAQTKRPDLIFLFFCNLSGRIFIRT